MENLNIEQIKEVYNKLGIPFDEESQNSPNSFLPQKWESSQFGIYTEDGFNYTNNTIFTPKQS